MNQRRVNSLIKVIEVNGTETITFNNGDIIEEVIAVAGANKTVTFTISEANILAMSLTQDIPLISDLKLIIGDEKELVITTTGVAKVMIRFYNPLEAFSKSYYVELTA